MGRKASGKERVDIIHRKQKNGSIYVIRRISGYNREKGYYTTKHEELLGKILPGSDEIIETRPKAENGSRKPAAAATGGEVSPGKVAATGNRAGSTAIAAHIGEVSGIDEDVYRCCDEETAEKIIALARYCLLTDGRAISRLEIWQVTHSLEPCKCALPEATVQKLFARIGAEDSIRQRFFLERTKRWESNHVLVYDSTSTDEKADIRSRCGHNKADDVLETERLLTVFSMPARQPICYISTPGNIPDIKAIHHAVSQLDVPGLKNLEIVTDCGFCSEENLSGLLQSSFHFLTRVEDSVEWVRCEVDKALEDLESTGNMCPFEPGTYGVTVCLTRSFERVRRYGSAKKGMKAGDSECVRRRVYLHIFVDSQIRLSRNRELDRQLSTIRNQYLAGERDFKPGAANLIRQFLIIREKTNGEPEVTFNTRAILNAKKYHGILTLVASKERDTFEALGKYRKREWIEEYRQGTGGRRSRVWSDETLDGKKLVQFVALCYLEHFIQEIDRLKRTLGVKNGDPDHDLRTNLDKEEALKSWLETMSVQEILEWFDAAEKVDVVPGSAQRVRTTEVMERDRLFLTKLGINLS